MSPTNTSSVTVLENQARAMTDADFVKFWKDLPDPVEVLPNSKPDASPRPPHSMVEADARPAANGSAQSAAIFRKKTALHRRSQRRTAPKRAMESKRDHD